MTSDAKIGLLLGLVFIFAIAFIINGLPNFSNNKNNNELTARMVGLQNNPPAIAAKEREVIHPRATLEKQSPQIELPSAGNQDVRFETALPKSLSIVKDTDKVKLVTPAQSLSAVKKHKDRKTGANKAVSAKIYVVEEGDSLAFIAQKFYGSEEGNKIINITRIFEANRRLMKSPDEVYVGQRLIIPPLSASLPDKSKTENIFSATEFAKVESIGERHSWTGSSRRKPSSWYVVAEGDSLWQVAAKCLGDGSRYGEIARLNAAILDDEDRLFVGMRLKLPVR